MAKARRKGEKNVRVIDSLDYNRQKLPKRARIELSLFLQSSVSQTFDICVPLLNFRSTEYPSSKKIITYTLIWQNIYLFFPFFTYINKIIINAQPKPGAARSPTKFVPSPRWYVYHTLENTALELRHSRDAKYQPRHISKQ